MFTATVKGFQRFPEITADIEKLVAVALDEAMVEAATVAEGGSSISLELERIPAHGTVGGFSSGIKSRKQGHASSVLIAEFFNDGTLGKRTKKLKRPRRESWQTSRGTDRRGDVTGKGISPQRFFQAARSAGRRVLIERIDQGL